MGSIKLEESEPVAFSVRSQDGKDDEANHSNVSQAHGRTFRIESECDIRRQSPREMNRGTEEVCLLWCLNGFEGRFQLMPLRPPNT